MKKLSLILIFYINLVSLYSQQWEWTKIAGGKFDQETNAVASDVNGSVYVAGHATYNLIIENDTLFNPWFCGFVAKFDKDGNYQWINRAGNNINAVATDEKGNVYLAGIIANQNFNNQYNLFSSTNNDSIILTCRGEFDIAIAKYTTDGKLLWVRTAGSKIWDEAKSISVDKQGNCYVTGFYRDTADFGNEIMPYEKNPATTYRPTRYFITKLDSDGNFIWTHYAFGPENDYSFVIGHSVNAGEDGSIYVTGSFLGGLDFGAGKVLNGESYFICKYSADGNLLWVKPIDGGESGCIPVVSDNFGNCYITASKYLIKFDAIGNLIYNKTIIHSNTPNNGRIRALALDTLHNKLFIVGSFNNIPTIFGEGSNAITLTASKRTGDAFVSSFDINGNLKWVTAPTGDSLGGTGAFGVSSDQRGNCFATGNFHGASATNFGSAHFENINPYHIFVSKIIDTDVSLSPSKSLLCTNFTIYPNPTAGTFQINYLSPQTEKSQLNIFNSKGSIVYTEIFQGDYNKAIDLGKKAKGVYIVEILAVEEQCSDVGLSQPKQWKEVRKVVLE